MKLGTIILVVLIGMAMMLVLLLGLVSVVSQVMLDVSGHAEELLRLLNV